MTDVLLALALLLVAVTATAAVLNREPVRQALVLSFLGLALALLFTFVQAPDVSLSQLAVGSAVTPLMIVLTVRKVRRDAGTGPGPGPDSGPDPSANTGPAHGRSGGDGPGEGGRR
ncbi:hydrogenase subunit MbhD domain-containing protein [Streptomyces nanshensis]|uniref:hydrogenase subunit MbhD domain-containing protein n=1 Tax=Streptomyces nanshensis TaxID=518642 RepID=UPI00099F482D|nr:hydrogenase subunit MbhD domain-containing protein [Streptomyces nanshensis]